MVTPAPLVGCAVADMLGKFAETVPADKIVWNGEEVRAGNYKFLQGVYHNPDELLNRIGVPTDDTQMSRIAGQVLREHGKYDPEAAAEGYRLWLEGKSYVGPPRGIGGTLKKAITRLMGGSGWKDSGERLPLSQPAGTGTAMRDGVLGMLPKFSDVMNAAMVDAIITHNHPDAVAGSLAMATAVHYTMQVPPRGTIYSTSLPIAALESLKENGFGHTPLGWALRFVRTYAMSGGPSDAKWFMESYSIQNDVVAIVATAILCAATARSYAEGVRLSIRMGGDTDTRAAMVGVILGCRFGLEGIPENWLKVLYEREDLEREDRELTELSRSEVTRG